MNIKNELARIYKATDLGTDSPEFLAEAIVSASDLLMSARRQGKPTTAIMKRIASLKKLIIPATEAIVKEEIIFNLQFTTWTEEVEKYLRNTDVIAEEVVTEEAVTEVKKATAEVIENEEAGAVTYNELTENEKEIVNILCSDMIYDSELAIKALSLIRWLTEYGVKRTLRVVKNKATDRLIAKMHRMSIPLPQ